MMTQRQKILTVVVLLLIAGNIFLGYEWYAEKKHANDSQSVALNEQLNTKVLDFTKLFIQDVLKAQGEIDFNTRLKLENAVRDLNDNAILAQWEKFTGSQTETEAQDNVKALLELLVDKIKTQ